MNETINDRIESLIKEKFNGNKAAFAKSLGMKPTGLSSYLGKQRRSKPSIDMVIKIITNHDVDPRWLLLGEVATQAAVLTAGSCSPASESGDVSVAIGEALLVERIRSLEALLAEKSARIDELKERIDELKMAGFYGGGPNLHIP